MALVLLLLVIGLALSSDQLGLKRQVQALNAWLNPAQLQSMEIMRATFNRSLSDFENARSNRSADPTTYCRKVIELAGGYRMMKDNSRADELFEEAFDLFTKSPALEQDAPELYSAIGRYAADYSKPEDFDSRFTQLMQSSERNKIAPANELDSTINDILTAHSNALRSKWSSMEEWRKVIDTRASVRGDNDPSLTMPLIYYAEACEIANDLNEAEKARIRAVSLEPDTDTSSRITWQIDLAMFYLRHGMRQKADNAWHQAEQMAHGLINDNSASGFLGLADDYKRMGLNDDREKIITTLLALGGNCVVKVFDPSIEELVSGYITSGSLAKAENLLRRRVEASSTCTADANSNEWRIKLSDLYLAMGRTDESNKLYQKVLAVEALAGHSTETIRKNRADLLTRLGQTKESNAIKGKLQVQAPATGPIKIE
ncbi:MAG: hypothetical protein JST01_13435 [Cyanobacteria bacterium SZAS TMP-1]|nr:hypothetical protein [Cyanobacteria bacterium SZAS TMP-1]